MISLETVVERALLVGAPMKGAGARRRLDEHLEELSELADTAGATVVGEVTQLLDRPHPGTYLGSGKLEELKSLIDEKQATLVIFDDELTPAQLRNIENAVGKRVMDRAELILDIFAVRARTSEAQDAGGARAARISAAAPHAHVDPPREVPRRHRHARPR